MKSARHIYFTLILLITFWSKTAFAKKQYLSISAEAVAAIEESISTILAWAPGVSLHNETVNPNSCESYVYNIRTIHYVIIQENFTPLLTGK